MFKFFKKSKDDLENELDCIELQIKIEEKKKALYEKKKRR